jgi:hypothetical protein
MRHLLIFVATALGTLVGVTNVGICCEWLWDSFGHERRM